MQTTCENGIQFQDLQHLRSWNDENNCNFMILDEVIYPHFKVNSRFLGLSSRIQESFIWSRDVDHVRELYS
jgi:hypothetical protein